MATFRYSAAVVLALLLLGCSSPSAQQATAEVALIARDEIEHVAPKRDFVGPRPARFEWTAASLTGGRRIADSGRAAFVVAE
jgi:hypothetical protein